MRQNSYGFRTISSCEILSLEKNRSFAPGPRGYLIKNCFGTIEGLHIGFNCTVGIFASQDSYGFTAIFLRKN